MKITILIVCLLLLAPLCYADNIAHHKVDSVAFKISDWKDTAQISKLTPTLAVMGFAYADTFSYHADTTIHETVTWTSPMQAMRWTLGPITATPGIIDTTILLTVGCTISFVSQNLGVEYDTETGADDSLATAIDSIVAIFNAAANLSDSVSAEDSVTYIVFRSLIGEGVLTAPWSMLMSTDSTDTASLADSVTIAMICDSMVAAINANDSLPIYLTAKDSGTFYTTTSTNKGVLFYHTFLNHADTHGTLAATQANVTSNSSVTDTIFLAVNFDHGESGNYDGILGSIYMDSVTTNAYGIGLSDSAQLSFGVGLYNYTAGAYKHVISELDSATYDFSGALPGSLYVSHNPAVAGSDTLFKEYMYLIVHVSDTASDVGGNGGDTTVYLKLWMDYLLMDDQ